MKQIEVVAAIIRKEDKIFATQRGYGDFKDWWEFPGGKMEVGETPESATGTGDWHTDGRGNVKNRLCSHGVRSLVSMFSCEYS